MLQPAQQEESCKKHFFLSVSLTSLVTLAVLAISMLTLAVVTVTVFSFHTSIAVFLAWN
jgi:hypothetical protein